MVCCVYLLTLGGTSGGINDEEQGKSCYVSIVIVFLVEVEVSFVGYTVGNGRHWLINQSGRDA
jgi:hypothetical protein